MSEKDEKLTSKGDGLRGSQEQAAKMSLEEKMVAGLWTLGWPSLPSFSSLPLTLLYVPPPSFPTKQGGFQAYYYVHSFSFTFLTNNPVHLLLDEI